MDEEWLWNGCGMAVEWLWNGCGMAVEWLWEDEEWMRNG
jgi:hypothetical protein